MTVIKIDNKVTAYHLTLLFVVIAGFIFLLLVDRAYRAAVERESDRRLTEAASTMQRHLSLDLNNLILVVADLRAFLLTQPDPPDSRAFTGFAKTLHNHYPALDALIYVGPERIIREIYPLQGNERAIGLDLSKRPAAPYIEQAIRERRLIVDPPHTLSNGQLAVVARLPLFRGEKLVGLAQAILNIPDIVQYELGDRGGGSESAFTLQLRDASGRLFWGEEGALTGSTQSRELVVGSGTWTLLVGRAKPPEINGAVLALIWGVGSLVLLFSMWGVRSDYRLRLALKAEVTDTTRELRLRNEELEREILQRQCAEGKVRKSEQRLREAQQIAHIGNWERRFSDNRILWSDELYHIFGFTPREFEPTFEDFMARIHPEDRDTLLRSVTEAKERKAPYETEYRIILPQGTIRHMHASGIVECDTEGRPLRIVGTVQDITDHKLALKALEESEQKYRAVMENASDGIVVASTEGQVLDINRRMQTLLGYSRDELLSLHVNQLHPAEDAEKLRIAFVRMREHGSSLFEHLLLRKDGTTTPVEVAGTLITFDNQQVALGVFRDIRERKRIEAELNQHRHNLEQLVEQRTAQLRAVNGELEAFSYSVSHDLRAPLRAINGFSAALRDDYGAQLDATGRDYLQRITSATERMGRLIDDLLHLSAATRTEMHRESVALSTLASEILLELFASETQRKARFEIAKGVTAHGDPTLCRSLLQNLLGNAWKFTRGKEEAVIEFGVTPHAGKSAYFVRDNGIGFAMRNTPELFKPFHRLQGADGYEGSGVGLAIVQRIVQRHGGAVWAESEPEQGATFYFTLGPE
ncbi:MAG TPA: PAS domain S-box protein [Gammaproteobacteria bacterium]